MKDKLKQYEKDLNYYYFGRKCLNDFSFKYAMLLELPFFIVSSIIFIFLEIIKRY